MRDAIERLLSARPEIELVGLASDFQGAVDMVKTAKPDVIVIDLHMTAKIAGESRRLREISDARFVGISASVDKTTAALAKKLGADVFVDKMKLYDELLPAILSSEESENERSTIA